MKRIILRQRFDAKLISWLNKDAKILLRNLVHTKISRQNCRNNFKLMDFMAEMDQIADMNLTQWGFFASGALLYLSAKTVAHRAETFYTFSAISGVLLSFVFLALFIRRFLPKVGLLDGHLIFLFFRGYSRSHWTCLVDRSSASSTITDTAMRRRFCIKTGNGSLCMR
jgi:hypothetical protein